MPWGSPSLLWPRCVETLLPEAFHTSASCPACDAGLQPGALVIIAPRFLMKSMAWVCVSPAEACDPSRKDKQNLQGSHLRIGVSASSPRLPVTGKFGEAWGFQEA